MAGYRSTAGRFGVRELADGDKLRPTVQPPTPNDDGALSMRSNNLPRRVEPTGVAHTGVRGSDYPRHPPPHKG